MISQGGGVIFLALFGRCKYKSEISIGIDFGVGVGIFIVIGCGVCQ